MAQERRHFQRIALDSPVRVLLDESENGFLLDLCEGGLAVCELGTRKPGQVVPFAFDLPEASGRIQGRAEIVWKSASGRRTGLHFVEMDDPCRERLVQWISTQAWTMRLDGVETERRDPARIVRAAETPTPVSPAVEHDAGSEPQTWMLASAAGPPGTDFGPDRSIPANAEELWTRVASDMRSVPPTGVAAVVLVLAVTVGFFLYHSRGTRVSTEVRDNPAAQLPPSTSADSTFASTAPSAAAPPSAPSVPHGPAAPAESPAAASRPGHDGVVLQVGAMTHEAYADALAKDLKGRNLPAFVFRREGDNFYRVAVGPFTDSESPLKAKGELEKQGLKPFVRPWEPAVESARN